MKAFGNYFLFAGLDSTCYKNKEWNAHNDGHGRSANYAHTHVRNMHKKQFYNKVTLI